MRDVGRCRCGVQEADFFKAKAERQAELLTKAELARMDAERECARMESKFTRSDKGAAMLKAARLKIELEACRERLAELESQVRVGRAPLGEPCPLVHM